jgi:hypothetical protein
VFSDHGDSGSVILDENNLVIGLLFAGNGTDMSFANQISLVLSGLQVQIITNGLYQNRILDTVSVFASETDGVWLIADYDKDGIPDLVFIKTTNTPSAKVEVHIVKR